MFIIIIFVLFVCGNGQFPDSEYCSIPCDTGQHTMCAYPPVSRHCLHVESLMNPRRRQKILSLHNSFRNAVAGGTHPTQKMLNAPSSNMRQLYWDLELEGIAERWAMQCNVSTNDDCRDVARFTVGQVMSKSGVLTPSLDYYDTLFNMLWFAEVDNLSQRSLSKYRKHRNIKHVAQILNSNTMRVGCADVITKRVRGRKPVRVTICNYGPAVISGEELYKIGHPCSSCPVGTKCRGPYSKYPHLCSEYRQFDIAEMKPNFVKIQMDYGSGDAPVLHNIDRKKENALSNQGQYRSSYNEEKRKLPNWQRQLDDKGTGNVERGYSRYKGKKWMNPESRNLGSRNPESINLDFDDQNGDYSDDRDNFGGRFLEDDYQHNGDNQDYQSRFGGRELDASRDLNNQTAPGNKLAQVIDRKVTHDDKTDATTDKSYVTRKVTDKSDVTRKVADKSDVTVEVTTGGNGTLNGTDTTNSSSLCIHSPCWYIATLSFMVMKLTFAIASTM